MSGERRQRGHVLVVDDEPDLLRALVLRLTAAGYRVTTAGDGLGAVAAVLADEPDLVVLDLVMPGLDGHAVMQRLRDLGRSRPLPVLCLSARTGPQERMRAAQAGATMFLTKPFEPAELMDAVGRLAAGALVPSGAEG